MSQRATLLISRNIRCVAALLMATVSLAACGPAATLTTVPSTPPAGNGTDVPETMDALVAAAKAEGTLTTIALPHDWCNYGAIIDGFKAKYGLAVNELNPDASSGQKLEAIRVGRNNPGTPSPDVIDLGFTFGPAAKDEGLLQPYKVSTWDTIPADAKDAEGYWYGDYYGVLSFMVNTDVIKTVPQDWADLLQPEYKAAVGLSGDPRSAHQAIMSVLAAALASGGTLDNAQAGLDFFANLNLIGNLVPLISNNTLVAQGKTPVRITWDYNALYGKDLMAGSPPVEVVIPKSGRLASVYVQAISKYAPHPNAARLWMEYLYSDEGQLLRLAAPGYCHPVRQFDLEKRGVIPSDLLAKLPSVEGVVFPSAVQLTTSNEFITQNWDKVVGAAVVPAP